MPSVAAQGLTRLRSLGLTQQLSNEGLSRLAPLGARLLSLQFQGGGGRTGGLNDAGAVSIGKVLPKTYLKPIIVLNTFLAFKARASFRRLVHPRIFKPTHLLRVQCAL